MTTVRGSLFGKPPAHRIVCGIVLQCVAVCCSALQCVAVCVVVYSAECCSELHCVDDIICRYTHCNTLQHTATHCNTLQRTATHYNTLQHTTLCGRHHVSDQRARFFEKKLKKGKNLVFFPHQHPSISRPGSCPPSPSYSHLRT